MCTHSWLKVSTNPSESPDVKFMASLCWKWHAAVLYRPQAAQLAGLQHCGPTASDSAAGQLDV